MYKKKKITMQSNVCQSQNYVWSTREVLGDGATCTVYKGRHKTNGNPVAVKVLNFYNEREFEILQKTDHENIVKLLAIECELQPFRPGKSPRKILVTELCTGGCLKQILEDPENIHGLDDSEFLLVLSHLKAGLKYLRDNDIVHRDLKPNNIMKFIKDDGTFVYKLIDFGAARELPDGKDFQSLHGTEEYLFPDMYGRAMFRKQPEAAFQATVDLWSIGVTLYHVATGNLPFRPHGGRRNRDTMYYITTKKESGVISGVQDNPNGPITWSTCLPEDCLLSSGLKALVTPLIAGLLESNHNKIWSFEKFFVEVDSILVRQPVNVFFVNTQKLIKIYLKPDDDLIVLQNEILRETGVEPNNQLLIHKSALLLNSRVFPPSTENKPFYLFQEDSNAPESKKFHSFQLNENFVLSTNRVNELPISVNFSDNSSIITDSKVALKACFIAYEIKKIIEKCTQCYQFIVKAIENIINCTAKEITKSDERCKNVMEKNESLRKIALIFDDFQNMTDYEPKMRSCKRLEGISDLTNIAVKCFLDLKARYFAHDLLKNLKYISSTENAQLSEAVARAKKLAKRQKEATTHLIMGENNLIPRDIQYAINKNSIKNTLEQLHKLKLEVFEVYSDTFLYFQSYLEAVSEYTAKLLKCNESLLHCENHLKTFEQKLDDENKKYTTYIKSKPKQTNAVQLTPLLQKQLKNYKIEQKGHILKENERLRNLFEECDLSDILDVSDIDKERNLK